MRRRTDLARINVHASNGHDSNRMKQVELVRRRVANGMGGELKRIRIWLSMTDNTEATDKLSGTNGDELLAFIVEATLEHLGHSTAINTANQRNGGSADSRRPQARKAVAGAM